MINNRENMLPTLASLNAGGQATAGAGAVGKVGP
jgi:hypothetical protein